MTRRPTGKRLAKDYGLPGRGPWRILSQCPSRLHNAPGAAHGADRCICPRAIVLTPVRESPLPGGGPWRIYGPCPAEKHNTFSASCGKRRAGGGEYRCTCPRALALNPNAGQRLPGGGPWRILETCPSTAHNTASASVGRARNVRRCVCPRALALKPAVVAADNIRHAAWVQKTHPAEVRLRERAAREGRVQTMKAEVMSLREYKTLPARRVKDAQRKRAERHAVPEIRSLIPTQVPDVMRRPDLSRGRCHTNMRGPAVFGAATDVGMSGRTAARQAREAAKALCSGCPMLAACAAWAVREETPAGSWGGVIGGMDISERVRRSNAQDQH
jgi:hypothetical protein